MEKRDSELQATSQRLEAANRLAKGIKTELDYERSVFQSEKDGLLCELEQALADKAEVEKQVDEDVVRLQKEVNVFKFIKYRDGYNDGAQDKPPRYPLRAGILRTKGRWKSWSLMLLQCLTPPPRLQWLDLLRIRWPAYSSC